MRRQEDGLAQVAKTPDDLPRRAARRRVETRRRLVQEDQLRIPDQRERDIESATLTARELLATRIGFPG